MIIANGGYNAIFSCVGLDFHIGISKIPISAQAEIETMGKSLRDFPHLILVFFPLLCRLYINLYMIHSDHEKTYCIEDHLHHRHRRYALFRVSLVLRSHRKSLPYRRLFQFIRSSCMFVWVYHVYHCIHHQFDSVMFQERVIEILFLQRKKLASSRVFLVQGVRGSNPR